jgi:soluble lytic murein transglycosylase-like protein
VRCAYAFRSKHNPDMRKRLQLALMASPVIATFLSLATPCVQAQTGSSTVEVITTTTDQYGRKVYVNEEVPVTRSRRSESRARQRSSLVFWSVTEHRWKPVPSAHIRAARSAAAEINRYLGHDTPQRSTSFQRGKQYTEEDVDAAIEQAARRHNVDPDLVRAVIKVESNFNPNAVSRKGAMGLMQLMPQTARSLNVTNPFDPQQNVDAGVRHLKKLMESYGGDIKLSLAAYNAGSGAVARSAGVPHFAETRKYVKRITQLYYGGSDPETHIIGSPVHDPIRVQRDARGVLYISNTD